MKNFYKIINFLKKQCPADLPIKIRRVKVPSNIDGDCTLKDDYYLIRINKNLPEHIAIDTYIHEHAHCLTLKDCKKDYHDHKWGIAYSKVYRAFLKEFFK